MRADPTVTLEESSSVRFLQESELKEMEKDAPWAAGIARQQAQELKDAERRSKPTRTVAWLIEQIDKQQGCFKRA